MFQTTSTSSSLQQPHNDYSTISPSEVGLAPTDKGLRNPGFLCVPHDPSDITAGAIQGYFDADSPDPRVLALMDKVRRDALSEIESKARVRDVQSVEHSDPSDPYSGPKAKEISAFSTLVIRAIERAGMNLCDPIYPKEDYERVGPPLFALRVWRRKKGRGIRLAEHCTSDPGSSVWIESALAARLFRKKDVFFLAWGNGACHFLPPTRKSWRGWKPW